jgi:hypothetical protein
MNSIDMKIFQTEQDDTREIDNPPPSTDRAAAKEEKHEKYLLLPSHKVRSDTRHRAHLAQSNVDTHGQIR